MKTTLAIWIGTLIIATTGSGCGSDESLAGTDTTTTATAATVPSFSELDNALSLEGRDETVVKEALATWKRDAKADQKQSGFTARRHEMQFVAEVTPSLDNAQLEDLVSFFLARRDARREDLRAQAPRGGGKHVDRIAKELDLSTSQQADLKALHQETRAKTEAQRDAFDRGTISEDQLQAELAAIHKAQREKMSDILNAGQLEKLDKMRDTRFAHRLEQRSQRGDERMGVRVAWLDSALELSDAQTSQVKTALEAMNRAQDATLAAAKSGSLSREDAHRQIQSAHDAFRKSLEEILTPEQATRLDILQELLPGRRHHA